MNTPKKDKIFFNHIPNMNIGLVGVEFSIGGATPDVKSGVAHFLEHMLCEAHQDKFENGLTGQTTRDSTIYWSLVSKKKLKQALDSFSFYKTQFCEEEIEAERQIIINEEKTKRRNPINILIEMVQADLFDHKGYGSPIIGTQNNINLIKDKDLREGLSFYKEAHKYYIMGPWDIDTVEELITSPPEEDLSRHVSFNSKFSIKTTVSTYRVHHRTYYTTAIIIPGKNAFSEYVYGLLKIIWENRIMKKMKNLHLFTNIYDHAGVLIFFNEKDKDINSLGKEIILEEITKNEFNYARALFQLKIDAYHEGLSDRLNPLYERYILEGTPEYNTIQEYQEMVRKILKGFYVYPNKRISTLLKPNNFLSKKTEESDINSEIICSKVINDRYLTVSKSPLTNRFHIMIRVNCLSLGRLLVTKDIEKLKGTIKDGFLTSLRYEGLHTLLTFSFYQESSLLNFIKRLFEENFHFENLNENHHRFLAKGNFENEIKYILFNQFTSDNHINPNLVIEGLSIVGMNYSADFVENIQFIFSKTDFISLLKNCSPFDKKDIIFSSVNGAVVLYELPLSSLEALVLQEVALAKDAPFTSLVELVRNKGIDYGITQSICKNNEKTYIYWAVQCEENATEFFFQLVREWLITLVDEHIAIEKWILERWVPFNMKSHKSISQLLRDVDRYQYYCGFTTTEFSMENFLLQIIKQYSKNIKIKTGD
jgi:hypothetical protein